MLAHTTSGWSIFINAESGLRSTIEAGVSEDRASLGGEALAALADEITEERFRSWRGISGRRYIFSVYDSHNCPAYCEAVLIAVAIDKCGAKRAVAFAETGTFPEPVLSQLTRSCVGGAVKLEFHMHLLANTAAERNSILEDLKRAA